MEDKISIIIPIFNAEDYIEKCLESVLYQTYENLEIILVDDGSTDMSSNLCDKFAERDCRIHVIHKDNGGVSSAREAGLTKATGEYIAFIDVDDLIDKNYIQTLFMDAKKYNADIACCGCFEIEGNYVGKSIGNFCTVKESKLITNIEEYYSDYYERESFYGQVVWGKIIRKSLAIKEHFESIKYGEDVQYMMKLFSHSPITFLDSYKGYYYIRWDQSATIRVDSANPSRIQDSIKVAETMCIITSNLNDIILKKKAEEYYGHTIYATLSACVKSKDKTVYKENKEYFNEKIKKSFQLKSINTKHRLAFILYSMSENMYRVIFSLFVKGK